MRTSTKVVCALAMTVAVPAVASDKAAQPGTLVVQDGKTTLFGDCYIPNPGKKIPC